MGLIGDKSILNVEPAYNCNPLLESYRYLPKDVTNNANEAICFVKGLRNILQNNFGFCGAIRFTNAYVNKDESTPIYLEANVAALIRGAVVVLGAGLTYAVAACDDPQLFNTAEDVCNYYSETSEIPDNAHLWQIEGGNPHISYCVDGSSAQYIICSPGGEVVSEQNIIECSENAPDCLAGRCQESGEWQCNDSDESLTPDQYHIAASVESTRPDGVVFIWEDNCVKGSNALLEAVCNENRQPDTEYHECTPLEECHEGRCIPAGTCTGCNDCIQDISCYDTDSESHPEPCPQEEGRCEVNEDVGGYTELVDSDGEVLESYNDRCHPFSGVLIQEAFCSYYDGLAGSAFTAFECEPDEFCLPDENGLGRCVEGVRIAPVCEETVTEDGRHAIQGVLENGLILDRSDECFPSGAGFTHYFCNATDHGESEEVSCPPDSMCIEETATCEIICDGACRVYQGSNFADGVGRVIDGTCGEHPNICNEDSSGVIVYTCDPETEDAVVDHVETCLESCSNGLCSE